jgi:hypothetical protein
MAPTRALQYQFGIPLLKLRPRHRHQEVQEPVPKRGAEPEERTSPGVDRGVRELLQLAMGLWEKYHRDDREEFDRWGLEVHLPLSYHLWDQPLKDQDNQKLLRLLRRYHQRGNLLRFLEQPEVEPTNNWVERMLRLAVIARQVSQCSKTWSETDALAAFSSIIQQYSVFQPSLKVFSGTCSLRLKKDPF